MENYGANIVLTREGDYDLSTPNTKTRKKSDFDNRIKIINESDPLLFISIHQNYYDDSEYSGTQVFYKDNEKLGEYIQEKLNSNRKSKEISSSLYMYRQLNSQGLLIECGFLSNPTDRTNLTNRSYQKEYAKKLAKYLALYFKNN